MSDPEIIRDDEAVRDILDRAAELPVDQRPAFLDSACMGNESQRREVESLLAALDAADHLMGSPTAGVDPGMPGSVAEKPGTVIGRYKILQQIGEGGFGVVFMAEQQHPVRRVVALKVLKPGMDTRQVIARFEAERQALAMMDHPNIAKVLDAGTTETGRPFFAMELVRGSPLTEFCDKHRLSTSARLRLFVEVCEVVQHAHGKGIIHRDLKPSNVLVTVADDGRPVPKVIDFGIAKAIFANQRLTDRTLFTEFRQLVGTPQYMSPEQAEADGMAAADTRSDVYALGVLLYELLTGSTPFEKERLARAASDEVRRILREEEPPHPSTRLSTLAGDTLTSIATQRDTDPKRLEQLVRGELDWIVMRAMEKDRNRRYPTANGLARDVERFLADEPVEACPPSRVYRLRKTLRRHKAALATVVAIAIVLIAATAVSTWAAVRARRAERQAARERDQAQVEKHRADEQASRAKAVSSFVAGVLSTPARFTNEPPDRVTVMDATHAAVKRLDAGELDGQPLNEAAVRLAIADMLGRLRRADEAEPNVQKALAIRRAILPAGHPDIAEALAVLGGMRNSAGMYEQAEPVLRESLAIYRAGLPEREFEYSYNLTSLANTLVGKGKLQEAEQLSREALTIRRRIRPAGSFDIAHALLSVSQILQKQHKDAEAEPFAREAVGIYRNSTTPDQSYGFKGGGALRIYADVLSAQGKKKEAESLYRELEGASRGSDSLERSLLLRSQGSLLKKSGRAEEAVPLYREVLEIVRHNLRPGDEQIAAALHDMATVLKAAGKDREAEELCDDIQKNYLADLAKRHLKEGDTPDLALALVHVGAAFQSAGRFADAEAKYREALAIRRKLLGEQNSLVVEILRRLCQFLQSQGKAADAQAIWRESVEIRERQLSVADTPDRHAALYLDLVTPMLDAGQVDQAKEFCGKALDLNPTNIALLNSVAWLLVSSPDLHQRDAALAVRLAERAVALSPTDGNIVNTLGVAQYRAGNFKEAIEVLQHSVELHKAKPEPSDFLFLAMAYQKGGDAQAARRCYDKANSLNIQATQNPELRLFLDEAKEVMAASDPRKLSPR